MILNPEIDLQVQVDDLTAELRRLPMTLYNYYKAKANAERIRDIAKASVEEAKARAYKRVKSDPNTKHTEKSLEAEVALDPDVLRAKSEFFQAEHDLTTWIGAVESVKAKKDSLIQLASDRRKEVA